MSGASAMDGLPALVGTHIKGGQAAHGTLCDTTSRPRQESKPNMRVSALLTGCLVAFVAMPTPSNALTLASRGKTDVVIVTPREPSPSVARAAGELQMFLGRITGAEFKCVTEAAPPAGHEIVLGAPERLRRLGITVDLDKLGPEGYLLRTVDGHLVIAGSDVRGVMYGVYGLLQDHLGCRWFTPDVSHIPTQPTLELPELNETVVPVLEYRWPAVRDCYDPDWCTRNRVNVGPKLTEAHGGSVQFCGWAHTFAALVPAETYYDEHPEYFAMVGGERLRQRTQLCCTNEEVIQLAINGIRQRMRTNPDATYFSVSQNDWGNYCQCPRCAELAAREESQMGPVLQLVNRVADAVVDEFPDKRVTTLAYQWSRKPPKTLRPRPNVTIRLCSIECCFAHPLPDCDYAANVRFCEDIRTWSAICENLWIWNYTTNFRAYYLPHPALRALNDDVKFFVAHNVKGIYEQDTKLTPSGEMSPLGGYMMARFLWNPEYDEETAANEFLAAVYGDAAPHIRAYIDLIHDKVEADNIHLRCFTSSEKATFLTAEILAEADRLFDRAEDAVREQADVLRRVRFARMPVDYATVERIARGRTTDVRIDHATFSVTPAADVSRHAKRFLSTAREAGVMTVSERRFTLDQYEETVATLLDRRLTPHDPVDADTRQSGVRAAYYEADAWPQDRKLAGLQPVATMTKPRIDLEGRKRNQMFGFVFTGLFHAPADGVYTFQMRAESGSELRIAGEVVVDSRRVSSADSVTGMVALRKGWHPIRLRFLEYGHNDGLALTWSGPGVNKAQIEPNQLAHLPD